TVEIIRPWNEGIGSSSDTNACALQHPVVSKQTKVLNVGVFQPHREIAVEVAAEACAARSGGGTPCSSFSSPSYDDIGGTNRFVDIRCNAELPIFSGKEVQVKIGSRDIEAVIAIVADARV